MRVYPTKEYEQQFWDQGLQFIAGVDEVGRGAFAGPVVAASVILPQKTFPLCDKICDSKMLSAKQREKLAPIIQEYAIGYAITEISVDSINQLGIGQATQQAFYRAVIDIHPAPEHVLIDAFYIDSFNKLIQTPIVKGDQKCLSIAAASIIAKVYRDALMGKLHEEYPEYNFVVNKGYGTNEHRECLKKYGLSSAHRLSFNLQKYVV